MCLKVPRDAKCVIEYDSKSEKDGAKFSRNKNLHFLSRSFKCQFQNISFKLKARSIDCERCLFTVAGLTTSGFPSFVK